MLATAAQVLDTTSTLGEGATRLVKLGRDSSNVIVHVKGGKAGKEIQVISYGKTAMLLTAVRDEKNKRRQQGFGLQGGLPVGDET